MTVSKVNNAPATPGCWQTMCQNKKAIVGAASVALFATAIILKQRYDLYDMQNTLLNALLDVEKSPEVYESGTFGLVYTMKYTGETRDSNDGWKECPPSYTPYKLEAILSRSKPNVTGLIQQVKALYNDATNGTALFSSYRYHATRDFVQGSEDAVKASFLICRSSF